MQLRNHMELVVDQMMPSMLNKYPDICTCEKCKADIKAFALNQLPPKYFVTEQGELYSKAAELTIQFEVDVTRALIQAMEKIGSSPRHE